MHTVFALLCFVVVIHLLIFPYPSGLLHWHCGNLTIAPVPAKQPWWIWIYTSCKFIMNDCITTTKQSTTKPCAYFLGYTVPTSQGESIAILFHIVINILITSKFILITEVYIHISLKNNVCLCQCSNTFEILQQEISIFNDVLISLFLDINKGSCKNVKWEGGGGGGIHFHT